MAKGRQVLKNEFGAKTSAHPRAALADVLVLLEFPLRRMLIWWVLRLEAQEWSQGHMLTSLRSIP